MSATGPELPPHLLAKRKRQQDEQQETHQSTASGANHEIPHDKRQRVAGPAPPPASLDQRPTAPPDLDSDDESDSDDDFGPAPPSAADAHADPNEVGPSAPQPTAPVKTQRDEWMMLPPQQDDLAARMDPTKLRARGFNTGKSARGGGAVASSGIAAAWTETPEQKLKRLQDEAMGVKPVTAPGPDARDSATSKEREAEARRIREQTEKSRGPSLMEQHQGTNPQEKEDDPSKRAFDREKDIGGGKLGHAQKKEMLNKASNFTSKFSGGGYL